MVTNFEELVSLCDKELLHREYRAAYYDQITNQWDCVRQWLKKNGLTDFSEEIGNRYCDENFGTHLMPRRAPVKFREKLRAVRLLVSYQKTGDFEFRCPKVEYIFNGIFGNVALDYLDYCKDILQLSYRTIEGRRFYLHKFCQYLNVLAKSFDDLSVELTEKFFESMEYSLASRHNAARNISLFLKYVYDIGKSKKDTSVFILPDNYRKNRTLPTTYEETEIKEIIASVDRSSAIGKRDYLILLLAAEYGWRASDITSFSFDDIDWDENIIHFRQHKTDVPAVFPLLSAVGNAIIDYLKNARPESGAPEIILSMENANKGKPLSSPTIHSVVTKYMKRAGIKNWQNKKHGPHAMRHSLATNLLKKNIAMPVISSVMGHQRTETTSVYISVDYDKLKQCALPMPTLRSPFYGKEANHAKV